MAGVEIYIKTDVDFDFDFKKARNHRNGIEVNLTQISLNLDYQA